MAYKYITENNLYHKQSYMYSEYGGIEFLKEYVASRREYLNRWERQKDREIECVKEASGLQDAVQDLQNIRQAFIENRQNGKTIDSVKGYTKSFEVRKRIYREYDNNWKPTGNMEFEDYEAYIIFAECLVFTFRYTKCLKYFSCLLKVDDTLLSVQDKLNISLKKALYNIIKSELDIFYQLTEENGIGLEE